MKSLTEQGSTNSEKGTPEIAEYRKLLITIEQRVSEQFDKTIITIAGGSLAISLAFIKDVVGEGPVQEGIFLIIAWACLTACLMLILGSFYMGLLAYRKAQNQVDEKTIQDEIPGGIFSTALSIINATGIILLCIGLVMLFTFAYKNLSKELPNGTKTDATTSTETYSLASTHAGPRAIG